MPQIGVGRSIGKGSAKPGVAANQYRVEAETGISMAALTRAQGRVWKQAPQFLSRLELTYDNGARALAALACMVRRHGIPQNLHGSIRSVKKGPVMACCARHALLHGKHTLANTPKGSGWQSTGRTDSSTLPVCSYIAHPIAKHCMKDRMCEPTRSSRAGQ
jgi:hypothetical protein